MVDELNIKVGVTSTAGRSFARLRSQTGKLRTSLKTARPAMRNLGAAALRTAKKAASAASRMSLLKNAIGFLKGPIGAIGSLLKGALTAGLAVATGAAVGLGAAVTGLRSAFGGMYDAMEGSSGATGALENVDDQANDTADGLKKAADTSKSAVAEIGNVFGAWSAVGEGFVQTQGKLADQAEKQAKGAVGTAKDTVAAMDDAKDSIGGAATATTRFGKAVTRIAAAFNRAKTIILRAIARAITPALEKFADLLESPTFQKFVDLLAKDLAKAAEKVADWFIKDVIPAIEDFMEAVVDAGGPVDFLIGKWEDLKSTVESILDFMQSNITAWSTMVRFVFFILMQWIESKWGILGTSLVSIMQFASDNISVILLGVSEAIKFAINTLIGGIETVVNAAIRALRPFIAMYNAVAGASGGAKIDILGRITLPRLQAGGIVDRPTAAIVGDSPGGEAVIPLTELPGIIQEALGNSAGGVHIGNITVPPGTTNPQGFGELVGNGIANALRRSGQRVPTI